MTGVDPTTAPELDAVVWRDRDGDHWRFSDREGPGAFEWDAGIWHESPGTMADTDAWWGPLVAVGHLPAWTGPDDDVEPDVPAVTE